MNQLNTLLDQPLAQIESEPRITGKPRGPQPASVLVVGEAFGAREKEEGIPFVGESGKELYRMLEQAGFAPENIRYTNVVNERPKENKIENWFLSSKKKATEAGASEVSGKYPRPIVMIGIEELQAEIEATAPELILAFGNTALWALTGQWGITKWRGSLMSVKNGPVGEYPITVVPTYHPAAILRQWSWRRIAIHDLQYATQQIPSPIPEPDWNFIIEPDFNEAQGFLRWIQSCASEGRIRISADIETKGGQITCIGFGTDVDTAICVPFITPTASDGCYWTAEEEAQIVLECRKILTHPNVEVVWQNGIYDLQYIAKRWRFIANVSHDTMFMQHAAFPGALPKGLDFLASMYCNYRYYWKDEGKEWDSKKPPRENWRYNCLDCCRTFEVANVLLPTLEKLKLTHIYEHSMSLYEPVLFMMLNGVAIDRTERATQVEELLIEMNKVQAWINYVLDDELNVGSPQQMKKLFYDQIGLPIIRHRKTKKPTLDEDALQKISKKHPLLSPLTDRILALRSAGVFLGTFLKAPLDPDGRMRCQYDITGTETGRFSSKKNAFGRGTNLENIPRKRGQENQTPLVRFPNVRQIFIPDPGMIVADFDLDRADAHIVAWESGAEKLKELFRTGVDIHLANAFTINRIPLPPLEELKERHPKYPEHRKRLELQRQFSKNFCHGSNYGGKERAVAAAVSQVYGLENISVARVRRAQEIWFIEHPEIAEWHENVELELMQKRSITTVFGRTRYYFDRIDHSIVHQALAYLGQSPVADVINKGLRNVYRELPWCHLLLQNHDSIVVQFPADCREERAEDIKRCLRIPIPYEDELIIPVGYKYSRLSWGVVE